MRADLRHEGKRWFRQAQRDLDDAEFAMGGGRYHLACFLAQQAGEKALKGYLLAAGAEEVWGHSVRELCEDAERWDATWQSLRHTSSILDKYYIPTRYPDALPGGIPAEAFEREDAERAISAATQLLQAVVERLPGISQG